MKKLIVFLCVLGFCVSAYGDNSERIQELRLEGQNLQQNLTRYNQMIQNIQIRLVQVQAIIGELTKQDEKELEEETIEKR